MNDDRFEPRLRQALSDRTARIHSTPPDLSALLGRARQQIHAHRRRRAIAVSALTAIAVVAAITVPAVIIDRGDQPSSASAAAPASGSAATTGTATSRSDGTFGAPARPTKPEASRTHTATGPGGEHATTRAAGHTRTTSPITRSRSSRAAAGDRAPTSGAPTSALTSNGEIVTCAAGAARSTPGVCEGSVGTPPANLALITAAASALTAVGTGTLTFIHAEPDGAGWDAQVVASDGGVLQVRLSASGRTVLSGPRNHPQDSTARSDNLRLVHGATLNYQAALVHVEAAQFGTITKLDLEDSKGRIVWQATVNDAGTIHQISIDAATGKLITHKPPPTSN